MRSSIRPVGPRSSGARRGTARGLSGALLRVDPPASSLQVDHGGSGHSAVTISVVRAMRCRQWLKNVLVVGAPVTAGQLLRADVLAGTFVALLVFSAAASSIYLLNDVRDAEADRAHPDKRQRPVACGDLSERTAATTGISLGLLALAGGFLWAVPLGLTIAVYLVVQLAYVAGLKDQPAIDLAVVSSGFLLRAIAGGTATGIGLSPWFLLVAAFGSLFMVAGKRYSEIHTLGVESLSRASLQRYSDSYLRFIWTMAAGVTVMVYILWVLNGLQASRPEDFWGPVSVGPFVLGLLRYASHIDRGEAEAPEEIALNDHYLQITSLIWLGTLVLRATMG